MVIDDGSSDNTQELMEFYTAKDARIKFYIRPIKKNKGAAACRNYGIELAHGDFFQFLDSDDILHSKKLEHQISKLKSNDNTSLLTCKWGYFTKKNQFKNLFKYKQRVYRDFRKPWNLLRYYGKYGEFLPIHCFLIPKQYIISKAGFWNEELSNNDDAEFISRIVIMAKRIRFVPKAIVFYRIGNEEKLSDFKNRSQAISAIRSLELISDNLKQLHPTICDTYLKSLIKIIKPSIVENYPELAEFKNVQRF